MDTETESRISSSLVSEISPQSFFNDLSKGEIPILGVTSLKEWSMSRIWGTCRYIAEDEREGASLREWLENEYGRWVGFPRVILYHNGNQKGESSPEAIQFILSKNSDLQIQVLRGGSQSFYLHFPGLHISNDISSIDPMTCFPQCILPSQPQKNCGALYLGGVFTAQQFSVQVGLHLDAIVNCTKELPQVPTSQSFNIEHHRVSLVDELSEDILSVLAPTVGLIDSLLLEGKNVLVHCARGASRSASIVIAYIMLYHKNSLDDAYSFVKHCREDVRPNPGFEIQLRKFEEKIRG
tara:strand:+ start:1867 stop:2751 length:885 start_codon:yes stop_codon:yes gene_type:complete